MNAYKQAIDAFVAAEIEEIRTTRTLWVQQLTFGRRFQPIGLSIQRPEDLPVADTGGKHGT